MTATKNSNIIFWGTPELTLHYLEALVLAGYTIKAVVTQQDKPVGRKHLLTAPAPKKWAEERGIPVLQPKKLDDEFTQTLASLGGDISIVVAYGKIIPEHIINLPLYGTLNVHYSLLPSWRGATPVEASILHGDTKTGVSIQKMVFELDAGDIVAEAEIPLTGDDFAHDTKEKLSILGSELLVKILPDYFEQKTILKKQDDSLVTKCGLIKKSDGEISLSEDGEILWRKWRAFHPWPGLFFFQDGKRIKITEATFENNQFVIKKVIPEGKKGISWQAFKNQNS